ncbi:kallikrein-4-like [Zerene cesonia]|uniref:kallikrein-4-like n=1 Tax=Zerene cesonia TaxID=33412 RepID=UPI0018E5176E|nr:kallikrein-4-like [Zerene cesonia]
MKVAVILLCAFAAVQGRSVQPFEEVSLVPWLVHLRTAKAADGGLLGSCVGSVYNERWIISSASCLRDSRFIWIRFNAPNVYQPELVIESNRVHLHPEYNAETGENDIGLLDLNRDVVFSETIQAISVAAIDAEAPTSGKVCGYGELENGNAGEQLQCIDVQLEESGDLLIGTAENKASRYDLGAALVADDQLFGVLVSPGNEENDGAFLKVTGYADWIASVISPEESPEEVQVADPVEVADIIQVADAIEVADPVEVVDVIIMPEPVQIADNIVFY